MSTTTKLALLLLSAFVLPLAACGAPTTGTPNYVDTAEETGEGETGEAETGEDDTCRTATTNGKNYMGQDVVEQKLTCDKMYGEVTAQHEEKATFVAGKLTYFTMQSTNIPDRMYSYFVSFENEGITAYQFTGHRYDSQRRFEKIEDLGYWPGDGRAGEIIETYTYSGESETKNKVSIACGYLSGGEFTGTHSEATTVDGYTGLPTTTDLSDDSTCMTIGEIDSRASDYTGLGISETYIYQSVPYKMHLEGK